jgi:hypothetical protein
MCDDPTVEETRAGTPRAAHRALAVEAPDGMFWFWIGLHEEYKRLIRG